MKFLPSLLALSASLTPTLALPQPPSTLAARACTNPKVRKEWSKATAAERSSYISAVKCLTTKPSKLGKNHRLFDDFVYLHFTVFQHVHGVAAFLPWHRYLIVLYERELQACGYNGNAMYWDWVADSAAPSKAAVFDPVTGFGGNGTAEPSNDDWVTTYCVKNGPFSNLQLKYWNADDRPHCLQRFFALGYPAGPDIPEPVAEMLGDNYSPAIMAQINAENVFSDFGHGLENEPHAAVHLGVGGLAGDMGPQSSSPNDPLFFLHHTQVDRLWWLWQQQNPSKRTMEYNGMRFDGSAATLDDLLPVLGLGADLPVRDFMDVSTDNLCYKY
ncbi:monooxygenase [Immersiella caudata]|uniref:Monooxygenase n=1 Tax=Immersiella caudata TaxID=314043 RepID=A0AA39WR87_9PEZI|nr:monooxygenase [Immersiella caudata]